ncbi:oligosaccharide flippase family protein [Saccharospirillum sp.]|uniref:oligosaccharide flippase family protein n=1 Tax=Saccharospirillum sp. TaxID=2033801 RepID=UPI003298581A
MKFITYKSVLSYGIANGLVGLSPILLLPLLTTYMTREQYGEYSLYLILFNVLSILICSSANGSLAVQFHKSPEQGSLVASAYIVPLLSFPIVTLFFFPIASFFFNLPEKLLLIALISALFNSLVLIFLSFFQANGRYYRYLLVRIGQVFGDVLFSYILVISLVVSIYARLYAHLSAFLLALIVCYLLYKRGNLILKGVVKKNLLYKHLRFGLPLLPHAIAGSTIMLVDRIVLSELIGIESVGVFMVALQVGGIIMFFIEPVNKVFAPWLFKNLGDTNHSQKVTMVRYTYLYYIALVIFAFGLYLLSDLIVKILVSQEFSDASLLVPYILIGFMFQGMYYTVTNYILYSEKTGLLSKITVSVSLTSILSSIFLVYSFGIVGAAISFAFTNILLFGVVWYFSNRVFPMPWFEYKRIEK